MSEDKIIGVCPNCGAQNPDGFLFCSSCGTKLNKDNESKDDTTRVTKNERKPRATVEKVASWTSVFSNRLVLRSVTLAVAVILFIFAFLPLGTSTAVNGDEKHTLSYNAPDAIDLAISSLSFMSEPEIMRTDTYEQFVKKSLSAHSDKDAEQVLKLTYKLTLMNQKSGVHVTVVIAGVVALLYLVIAGLFLVFSAIAFATELIAHIKGGHAPRGFYVKAVRFLWLTVLLLPAVGFAVTHAAAPLTESGLGWALIVSLVIGLIAAVFVGIDFYNHRAKRGEGAAKQRRTLISLALIVLIFISLCLPAMTLDLTANVDGDLKKSTLVLDLCDIRELGADEIQRYANSTSGVAKRNLLQMATLLASGKLPNNVTPAYLLNTLTMSYGRLNLSPLNTVIVLLTLAIILFAAFLFWSVLRRMLLSGECGGAVKPLKVFLLLTAIAHAVVTFILSFLSDGCALGELLPVIDVDLGVGPILTLVFAVVLTIILESRENERTDFDYDNADTSYAPYVVE